jgi:hypothetical protein
MKMNITKFRIILSILFFITPYILFALEKPDFSHTRDFYETPFDLRLSSTTEKSNIKYTLDGTKPDQYNGISYDGSIQISKTSSVRAVTILNSSISEVRTYTFIFLNDVINQDISGVPAIQHSRDHVYWTEEFDINDVTQSEDEVKKALQDIPTISITAPYDSLFGIAGILRGRN